MSDKERLTADQCVDLYNFIAHGDEKHKAWLLDAIICWARFKPKPPENVTTQRRGLIEAQEGKEP